MDKSELTLDSLYHTYQDWSNYNSQQTILSAAIHSMHAALFRHFCITIPKTVKDGRLALIKPLNNVSGNCVKFYARFI